MVLPSEHDSGQIYAAFERRIRIIGINFRNVNRLARLFTLSRMTNDADHR